jgi:hypothetical protein
LTNLFLKKSTHPFKVISTAFNSLHVEFFFIICHLSTSYGRYHLKIVQYSQHRHQNWRQWKRSSLGFFESVQYHNLVSTLKKTTKNCNSLIEK